MFIFCIYVLLSAIVPFKSVAANTADDFWKEYQTAKQSKSVTKLIDHVQNLATRSDKDSPTRLEQKKSAILWFMATGGKNGFRKRPATPEEKKVMKNALIFATLVHEINDENQLLPIMGARRDTGVTIEDARVKKHLAKVQSIITATRIMANGSMDASSFEPYTQELYNKEYVPTVLQAKYAISISTIQWEQEAKAFSNIFTVDFDQHIKRTMHGEIGFRFNDSTAYIGLKEPATERAASMFRQLVLKSCTPDPKLFPVSRPTTTPRKTPSDKPVSHRAMRIVTENGLVIERGSNGSVKLVPQRDIKIGFMNLGAGSVMQGGTGLFMGPIQLSKDQTEEEFLAAISTFSAIVEKAYI
ncbi:MAG: hypothetical protein K2Q34_02540 [Alphaproteobacteria bacterium]|nr:hypothetical protein [Alphaproteobacteria bacterium]